jgi:hypothetical protein
MAPKLNDLQKSILLRALEGRATLGDRAREQEGLNAALRRNFGLALSKRVKRRDLGHLDRTEFLANYFGCQPRKVPEGDARCPFWWRKEPLKALGNESLANKRVKDLSPEQLERIVQKWCPRVKALWDKVSERVRQTYEALVEAVNERERRERYAYCNATLCRALRQLRESGYLEQASENTVIRLSAKGARVARRLAARATTSTDRAS